MKARPVPPATGCAAFAFPDLLAVAGLVIIFAFLLAPALAALKKRTRVAECLRNVKAHGVAASYLLESDGIRYEPWPRIWIAQIRRFDPALNHSFCPEAPARSPEQLQRDSSPGGHINRAWLVEGGAAGRFQGSYGLNGYFYRDDPYTTPRLRFGSANSVTMPAATPLFADSVWADFWPIPSDKPAKNLVTGDNFAGGLKRVAIPRHGGPGAATPTEFAPTNQLPGAVNLVFADSHAETVRLEKLWNFQWHREWVAPAKRPDL